MLYFYYIYIVFKVMFFCLALLKIAKVLVRKHERRHNSFYQMGNFY